MDCATMFAALDLLYFSVEFIQLAVACPYDDETLQSLSWIGANYYHPVDLESVMSRSRTQSDPSA